MRSPRSVVVPREFGHDIRRANEPRIVRKSALRVRSLVVVNEFSRGRDSIVQVVASEGEVFGIFDEVKQVSVGPCEFVRAVDAEGVVPNDPASAGKADLLAEDFQLGGVFVTDGQPEGAVRFQDARDGGDPFF